MLTTKPTGHLLGAAAVALAAAALAPAAASAATVDRTADGRIAYTASPGAKNTMSVQQWDDYGVVTLFTGGDTITSFPEGCTRSDIWPDDVVDCSIPTAGVVVELGDGDDYATVSQDVKVPVTMNGGPGTDRLVGGPRAIRLDGGAGDDQVEGGPEADVLLGGDGADQVIGAGGPDQLDGGAGDDSITADGYKTPAADVVEGGPGIDTMEGDYGSGSSTPGPPITVTLGGGADDGRPGEGDDLRGVERLVLSTGGTLTGSAGADEIKLMQVSLGSTLTGLGGPDRLRGGDGPDRLEGGVGDDSLDGGFGDDVLVGGPGRDTISADLAGGDCGPLWCKLPFGNDTVEARDGEVDSISCGVGTDRVVADAADVVAGDCEVVERAGGAAPPRQGQPGDVARPLPAGAALTVRAGRLKAVLRSGLVVRLSGMKPGVVAVQVRVGRKVVASGRVRVGAKGTATATLRFTAAARRSLARRGTVRLALRAGGLTRTVTVKR